jgi:hypothetical protein
MTMKTTALTIAALTVSAGAAFAGDFAATLHYPEARSVSRPATPELDHTSTGSIVRKIVSGKQQTKSNADAVPAVDALKK